MERVPERRLEPPPEDWREMPICPICGEPCDTVYRNIWGGIVGCDDCITKQDADYADECFNNE